MIDSHCHLTDPRLMEQLDQVLARAKEACVARMITIGTDPEDNQSAIHLAAAHANVRCAIGIHPNYCHEVADNAVVELERMAADPSVIALGEMGLDYHYNLAHVARQKHFFESQLALAERLDKPVVIHSREAFDDCLGILQKFPKVCAVFHCFTGTLDEGLRAIQAGYLLGLTGVVTFKRSDELRELAKQIPADRLLIETDAPYLSPEPLRKQKTNEPALLIHTANAVAAARGMSLAELDALTTANTSRFFRWD